MSRRVTVDYDRMKPHLDALRQIFNEQGDSSEKRLIALEVMHVAAIMERIIDGSGILKAC